MLRTRITPGDTRIYIEVPADYVGKDLEVLIYGIDEVKIDLNKPVQREAINGTLNGISHEVEAIHLNGINHPNGHDRKRDAWGRKID